MPATSTLRVLSLKEALWRRRTQYLTSGLAVLVISDTCEGRGMRSCACAAMGQPSFSSAAGEAMSRLLDSFPPLASKRPCACGRSLCQSQAMLVRRSSRPLEGRPARVRRFLVPDTDAALPLPKMLAPFARALTDDESGGMLSAVSRLIFPSKERHGAWVRSLMSNPFARAHSSWSGHRLSTAMPSLGFQGPAMAQEPSALHDDPSRPTLAALAALGAPGCHEVHPRFWS